MANCFQKKMALFASKLFTLLRTFSDEEMKGFGIWLKSPWCNTNKNLVVLFDKIKTQHPGFDNQKLTKEKLFKQVLPKGKYSDRRINNLLSEGFLAAQQFITFNNIQQDERLKDTVLTKELQRRYLDDWFFKYSDKNITELEGKAIKDWEDHLELLHRHRQVYFHPNQRTRFLPGSKTIVKMGEHLDLVYLLEKAAIINEKIFRNRILKDENHDVHAEIKKWEAASAGIDHVGINLYRMRLGYTKENMLNNYVMLKAAFFEQFKELNEKDQKVHLLSLLNDTTILFRANLLDITESLPIYKLGLETGLILHQGVLTYSSYVSIIITSNTKNDFEFTHHFIEKYTKKLDAQYRSDALTWARAHTAYYENNITSCLDLLLGHDFGIHYFQLIGKVLTSQAYFDLYLEDSSYQSYLYNYFDSFEKWLHREKLRATFTKKSFLRFIQKCRALAKHYDDVNFQPEAVKKLLENETNIQAANWLNKKMNLVLALREKRPPKH